MARQVFQPTKRGARQLTDYIKRNGAGTTVYTVVTTKDWGIGSEKLYNERVFDHRQPITGIWQTGHLSPEGLLAQEGPVYTEPPLGARYIGDPAPQVAGPLGYGDYSARLDEDELRGLAKQLRDAPHRGTRRI